MQPKPLQQDQGQLFTSRLSEQLNPEHELLKLAKVIPWHQLEEEFKPLFSEGPSRPPLPVRLAAGRMILQHMYDKSDENVVAAWVENPCWQAFCGYDFIQWELPVHPTSLTRWRQRIGPAGVEKILQTSIQVAVETKTVLPSELSKTICDTTVMPKAITHPTDAKLIQRSLDRIVKAAKQAGIALKRSYQRVSRWALRDYQRLMHGKRRRLAQKPLNKLRRCLSKMLRELDPVLESCPRKVLREAAIGAKLLLQTREDKHKIYSCYEPYESCIAKGKGHRPYEFGSKACLLITEKRGLALSMTAHEGNPYDGHLLQEAKEKAEKNTRKAIERILLDRGFRGHTVENAEVLVSYTRGLVRHLKKALRRRQAIKQRIGHMKQEGRLDRCYLKGRIGDQVHALLVAVGYNFRVILRKLRLFYALMLGWIERLKRLNEQDNNRPKAAYQWAVVVGG